MGDDGRAAKLLANFTRADQVEVKPVDWLIEGWLAKDSLAGMVGPSGSCKSFLGVDWACRVATGTPWCGHDVHKGAAFILAGEGRNGLRKRIEGWSLHAGVSIEGAPLYLAASLPVMTDQINTAAVIAEIDAMADHLLLEQGAKPSLIVIDTVARAMAGANENSAEHMGQLVSCVDWFRERWQATVLLIHHTGHDQAGRARGSSSYRAALDSELVLKPSGADVVLLLPSKCKDWTPPMPKALRRHPVSITIPGASEASSSLVLVDSGRPAPIDRHALVHQLREQGLTMSVIANRSGIPRSTVGRLLKDPNPAREFDDANK